MRDEDACGGTPSQIRVMVTLWGAGRGARGEGTACGTQGGPCCLEGQAWAPQVPFSQETALRTSRVQLPAERSVCRSLHVCARVCLFALMPPAASFQGFPAFSCKGRSQREPWAWGRHLRRTPHAWGQSSPTTLTTPTPAQHPANVRLEAAEMAQALGLSTPGENLEFCSQLLASAQSSPAQGIVDI